MGRNNTQQFITALEQGKLLLKIHQLRTRKCYARACEKYNTSYTTRPVERVPNHVCVSAIKAFLFLNNVNPKHFLRSSFTFTVIATCCMKSPQPIAVSFINDPRRDFAPERISKYFQFPRHCNFTHTPEIVYNVLRRTSSRARRT